MGKIVRGSAWLVLAALVLLTAWSGVASDRYRDFSGRIDEIGAQQVIVDNRMGDKVPFERIQTTEIEDTSGRAVPKAAWEDLERGDWVTVQWKMMDRPRKAHRVIVRPPVDEAGKDL
jgi:hypothetical protein